MKIASASLVLLAAPAYAQVVLQPLRPSELAPSYGGRWEGPYAPGVVSTGEITHAIHLPPNDAGGAPAGHVFFVANQYRNCNAPWNPSDHTRVWEWDPAVPGALAAVHDVPNTMHESLWCCGHAIAPSGDVFAVGGTDMTQTCYWGSPGIFRWTPSSAWQALGGLDPLAPRWYPCLVEIGSPNGNQFLVLGHEQKPIGPEETHQILNTSTGGLSPLYFNVITVDGACQPTAARARFMGYPWTHWLGAGMPFVSGPFADLKFYGCASTSGFRWLPAPDSTRMREQGNSLHFLDWSAGGREESIWLVGGLSSLTGPGAKAGDADWFVLDSMESIHAPSFGSAATWHAEPSMSYDRRHAVSVQTPDGNFIAIGGIGWDGPPDLSGSAVARTTPELFDRRNGVWRALNPQAQARTYHSVALLLRDGRIVSAGGVLDLAHTIEVFSPPYLFRGPRPTVIWAPGGLGYCAGQPCGTFTFTLDLGQAQDPIARVALLRPASVTHAFDQNQRYVELRIAASSQPDAQGLPLRWDLEVQLPEDWNVAPPGWYMLFAVTKKGIPAIAEFVRVG